MNLTTVYDKQMTPLAYLENAKVGYKKKYNRLWGGTITLPADDPKNAECQPFRFVKIYDGEDEVGLFRIMPTTLKRDSSGKTATYQLEHVLGTLLDDIIFQYHENDNLTTRENIEYVLGFQKTQRWVLGQCDFERFFSYKYENNKLYNFLKAIPEVFDEEYLWTWDTSSYPWTLNLIKPSAEVTGRILYGHNQNGITRKGDPRDCVTRMYALGYGEGVNQLTIESANPTGLPYIDADTQDQFGVIEDIIADRRFEDGESLYAYTKAELEKVKIPPVSYTCGAADVYPITGSEADRLDLGKMIRIQDDDLGLSYDGRIITYGKPDVNGAPGKANVEIARRPKDITDAQNDLRDRQRVQEVNAQGNTNLITSSYADNCDPDDPAKVMFYIHPKSVHVNMCELSYETSEFRGYTKGMASAGQVAKSVTSGASSAETTAAGGGKTSGASSATTTESAGEHRHMMGYHSDLTPPAGDTVIPYNVYADADGSIATSIGWYGGSNTIYTYGSSGKHSHRMPHYHSLPDHVHEMPHTHKVAINIDPHVHPLEFGIYKGPKPTAVTVKVDGNEVPNLTLSETDVGLVPYLAKDSTGNIKRGWHTCEVFPDDLGRISANVVTQVFIQSRGDYKI